MRLAIFIVLLALSTSVHAGVSSCRGNDRSLWSYVEIFSINGTPYYEVYCPNYPNPNSISSGNGGYSDPKLIVKYPLQAGLNIYKFTTYKYGF